jgi:hypothetical protein
MPKVRVYLHNEHPHGRMRARLANGEVIDVTYAGCLIDEDQVSAEMRGCNWYRYAAVDESAESGAATGNGVASGEGGEGAEEKPKLNAETQSPQSPQSGGLASAPPAAAQPPAGGKPTAKPKAKPRKPAAKKKPTAKKPAAKMAATKKPTAKGK